MDHYCFTHIDKKTRKKCRYCGKYICTDCQIPFNQQVFCSSRCIRKSLVSAVIEYFYPSKKDLSGNTLRAQRPRINWVFLWGFLLTLTVLAALTISIHSLTLDFRKSEWNKSISETVDKKTADDIILGMITEGPEARVTKNNVVISGEAADSLIISLKVNNVLTAVVLPEDGIFTFKNIELKIGENEIIVYAMNTAGTVTVLQRMTTDYGSERLNYMSRNITRGKRSNKYISLTFDGGSGNGATNDILDILNEKNIKCTMFLTGTFIKRFNEETKRIVQEGHEVGNHTWSHPHLTTFTENRRHETHPNASRKMLQHELVSTARLFKKTTGSKMAPYWRAPFGEHNQEVRQWAAEIGYVQIGWTHGHDGTMDSMDWVADTTSAIYKSSERVLADLLHFGDSTDVKANGSIVLMHLDTQRTNDPVHRIIPAFVDSMRARGYEFITVSELLKSKPQGTSISKKQG